MNKTEHVDVSTRSTWCNQKIVGCSFYRSTIQKLQRVAEVAEDGALHFPVTLIPEPDNPYSESGCAISVRWAGKTIGYIPETDAPEYWPEVCRITASGYVASAHARLWFHGNVKDLDTELYGSVALKDPGTLIPLNDPPMEGYAVIPFGGRIQVTKESDHFDVLQEHVPARGSGQIIVTLHRIMVGKNGDLPRIEVRLDNQRVGELTKVSSEKLLPAVEYFESMGLSTACNAQISGSSLAAEVVLFAQKATEMGDEIMDPEISPLPRFVEFELDPSDYDVPDAWQSFADDSVRTGGTLHQDKEVPEVPKEDADPLGDALLAEYYRSVVSPPLGGAEVPAAAPAQPATPAAYPAHMPTPAAAFMYAPQAPVGHVVQVPNKSFSTYTLLALFGGWLGLHHFYMGSVGKGLIYFMTGGLFLIGWIIDIFNAQQQFNLAMAAKYRRML